MSLQENHRQLQAAAPELDVGALRAARRELVLPFRLATAAGELCFIDLRRLLPGRRIVGQARFAGAPVLAKLFLGSDGARRAAAEAAGLNRLRAAGLPTPPCLATLTLPGGAGAVLTQFLPAAAPLGEALGAVRDGDVERLGELLAPAFALLGQLHAAGLAHADLHLGNFLQDDGKLYLIDGDAVASADKNSARRNLGVLLAQLPASGDQLLPRLLAAYAAGGGSAPTEASAAAARQRARRWRLRDYLQKSRRDCSLFAVRHSLTRFCSVRRSLAAALAPLTADPDAAIARSERLKSGNTCTVALARLDDPPAPLADGVVIKRYNIKNLRHLLGRLWRPSRAAQSWLAGHRLAFYGIATPAPLALLEERCGPLRRRAWLLTACCPGVGLDRHFADGRAPNAAEGAALRQLFADLARQAISHGDLKANNLLWHAGRIWLIDLDACRQHRCRHAWQRAWRRDRARLLRNWPPEAPLSRWLRENLPE